MKISVAQIKPVKGDIAANIIQHQKLIDLAVAHGADSIFFPELSLTGYEPGLAKELATGANDERLNIFQEISNKHGITIGAGLPTKGTNGILITMVIFQPDSPRQTYSKQNLHSDELPYFVNGEGQIFIDNGQQKIAPGICYETSLASHWEYAHTNNATIYIASVAKSAAGIERSMKLFPEMAKKYSMTVLLCNSLGPSDNFISAGQSAIWDTSGNLLAQLDDQQEGILLYDTVSGQAIAINKKYNS